MNDTLIGLLLNGTVAGLGYALLGAAFGFSYSGGRFFNVAFPIPLVVAAYVTCVAVDSIPASVRIIFAVFLGVLAGLFADVFLFRKLHNTGASALLLFVASLGAYTAFEATVATVFGVTPLSPRGGGDEPVYTILGAHILRPRLFLALFACVLLFVWAFTRRTQHVLEVRAACLSPMVAEVHGINVARARTLAIAFSSFSAAICGVALTFDTDATPAMGFELLLTAATVAFVGGVPNVAGALGAGLLLGVAESCMIGIWGGVWRNATVFLVLMIVMYAYPRGLMGSSQRT